MKWTAAVTGTVIMMCAGPGVATAGDATDGNTTVVQDSNGTTVISQSGDPAAAEVRVEKSPGRTTVYRRSGGNTAVVTQGTSQADIPPDVLDWLKHRDP